MRQGDTLSPFVIGIEALSNLISHAIEENYLSSGRIVDMSGEELVISHLLYVDDTLLFCAANKDQLKFISWTLMWFEAVLGLRIKLNNS